MGLESLSSSIYARHGRVKVRSPLTCLQLLVDLTHDCLIECFPIRSNRANGRMAAYPCFNLVVLLAPRDTPNSAVSV